jgi:hypothetical protein
VGRGGRGEACPWRVRLDVAHLGEGGMRRGTGVVTKWGGVGGMKPARETCGLT